MAEGLDRAEVIILAVGTPSENGVIDLRYIRAASQEIGAYIAGADRHISVVVKSTVVPGTTDTVVREVLETASGKSLGDFGLGMNPEFLREGEAIGDFMEPDRIVLGYEDDRTLERLRTLYAPWDVEKVAVNTRTAELIKYANNCLLATQISAVNEIANLAAAIGDIDIMDVMRGVHLDKRWNPVIDGARSTPQILRYLVPGCGFGGSCFPKDVQALRSQGQVVGIGMEMLEAVLDVNARQPAQVIDIARRALGDLRGRRVLLLGLAFKPDTDDVRESASLRIADLLLSAGAHVAAHDPIAVPGFRREMGAAADRIDFVGEWRPEVAAADLVIVATAWAEYRDLSGLLADGQAVFDARRLFHPDELPGATYLSIGRRFSGAAGRGAA
jgi:UDPglucose 6-dehydrogenase/GDP-mannose 6-dehydrogenase